MPEYLKIIIKGNKKVENDYLVGSLKTFLSADNKIAYNCMRLRFGETVSNRKVFILFESNRVYVHFVYFKNFIYNTFIYIIAIYTRVPP